MERQDSRVGDHAIYFAGAIVILGLLAHCASRSAVVLHNIDLPLIRLQAKIFSRCLPGDHQVELRKVENILRIVDAEVGRRGGYATIRTAALRKAIVAASRNTRKTARNLACAVLCLMGSLMMIRTVKGHRGLYDSRENVRVPERAGVEGFIRIVGRHLEPGMAERVRRSPTPENLGDAFRAARDRANIPCSTVARLFPKDAPERLVLLGYGKTGITFASNVTAGGRYQKDKEEDKRDDGRQGT